MNASTTLRIIAPKRGGPQVLRAETIAMPEPGPGEVRIRMLVAGVAFADIMVREGIYPMPLPWPRTPGYDVVGEIEAAGPDVPSEFALGTRVAALTVHGSYARHRLLPVAHCVPVSPQVDPAQAVALVLNYLTAYQMLHRVAALRSGDTVAVYAAAGGVGTAVLELAKLAGIRVIGLASPAKHELVRRLGGQPVDSRATDLEARVRSIAPNGVEAVLDPVGGAETRRAFRLLRPTGVLVTYGALSVAAKGRLDVLGALIGFIRGARYTALSLLTQGRGVVGYNVQTWRDNRPAAYREDLSRLMALLAEGQLAPLVTERIALIDAARAQSLLGEGRSTGKLVLI